MLKGWSVQAFRAVSLSETEEHPRPWRVKDRAILVGDAAGYVTKCSGEGIYFAAKSGRMWLDTSLAKKNGCKRQVFAWRRWQSGQK